MTEKCLMAETCFRFSFQKLRCLHHSTAQKRIPRTHTQILNPIPQIHSQISFPSISQSNLPPIPEEETPIEFSNTDFPIPMRPNDEPRENHRHTKPISSLPKRIILVRHGESQGNLNSAAYTTTPDYRVPLTEDGKTQARLAGTDLQRLISDNGRNPNWCVYFYVSPYERTRSTLREIGRTFSKERIIGVREECRIREQDFGNFQVEERMKVIKETRERFGRFFYRFPEGESAADVYDRVSSFLESLWRDIDMNRLRHDPSHDLNLIIISHGLTSRVFLTKWFKWTVEQFEYLNNPGNCEYRVMQLGDGGDYSLAIHHTEEELLEWGLTSEMIADQKWRANAHRGEWNEKCPWYLDAFFDHLGKSNGSDDCDEVCQQSQSDS